MLYLLWTLLIGVAASEVDLVANLVHRLDSIYHYKNVVVFRGEAFDSQQFDGFFNELRKGPLIPQYIATQTNQFDLQYAIHRVSLAVILAENESDSVLTSILTSLRGRRTVHVIFSLNNSTQLPNFFRWTWRMQFTKPLVVIGSDVFGIDPYPTLQVINVTSIELNRMFPKHGLNFKGYKIRAPVQMDVPRVFWYEGVERRRDLSGYGGRIIRYFTRFVNIELQLYRDNHTNYLDAKSMLKGLEEGLTELSVHPMMVFNRSLFGASYPIDSATYCLMQPLGPPIPKYLYIFLPFSRGVWVMIFVAFLFITIALSQMTLQEGQLFDFGKAATLAVLLIHNLPVPTGTFNRSNSLRLVYLQLFLFGFILSNLYLALLSSYLTLDVYGVQEDTLEAVIKRRQQIMAPSYDRDLICKYNDLPEEFYELFVDADTDKFTKFRNGLNPAYSYPMTSDRWHFANMQQMFMKRKRFWISSNMCFASFPLQFPLQYDSHLNKALSYFILASQETGLYAFWQRSAFRRAHSMGYVQFFVERMDEVEPLPVKFLTYILFVWAGGLLAAMVVFLIELNVTRLSRIVAPLRRWLVKFW